MVDFDTLNEFYNILDLYIVASRVEGGPRAINECALTKTPIYSTKVGIYELLLNNPEIILADEPTGNLDPATSSEIMSLIKEINESGTTILIATHDYDIISKFPEKTIRVEKERFFELSKKS